MIEFALGFVIGLVIGWMLAKGTSWPLAPL